MTIQEASNFLERLKNETTKKDEIKLCEKFLYMLSQLESRAFSKDEIQSIETELGNLNLKSATENRKKDLNKALRKFEKYLRDTFSLTPKGYYTNLGIGLGTSFGILAGIVFLSSFERSLGISLGLVFGMLIGLIIGRNMDSKAEAKDPVL
ncbi:hypothetical protein [Sunxiuqinia sp. sy24]|uniref:hypothetical protein n=1 Tax=Sunxiuqinia sp. sy24 TaxID=3461495 RepID=UPI00404627D6